MLASIRSKTGGAAALCCGMRRNSMALLTVSKPKEKGKNRSPSSEYTRLINLFECNLVPGWRCLVLLFPAPSTLDACPPKACLPSEGPYGETGRFCVEPPTFILQGDIPEGPHASSKGNNEVQSCPRCRCIFPRTSE